MQTLLISLTSDYAVTGYARLLDGGNARDWEFSHVDELTQPLAGIGAYRAVVCGADPESVTTGVLQSVLLDSADALWHAADVAYLFDQELSTDLDKLAVLVETAEAQLSVLDESILAQLCLLIQEEAAETRIPYFTGEMYRRFDPLTMPKAGQVDITRFYPAEKPTETPTRQDIAPDMLERVMAAREALASAFENYEERPQQIEMARAVEQALADSRPLVVEAGTGVGKSLAYLLPLAIYAAQTGNLCLVSTNTLNLQQQLIAQDVPMMRNILDTLELKVTLLKGREHYLCIKRLKDTWLAASPAQRNKVTGDMPAAIGALLFIMRAILQTQDNACGDLDYIPGPPQLRQRDRLSLTGSIDCRFQTCLGDRCEYKSRCHFFQQRLEAMTSHIVITNHALVFALYEPAAEDADNIVTRSSVIVFDEAHNLESAITNQRTLEVSHHLPVNLGNSLLEVLQHESCRKRFEVDAAGVDAEYADRLRAVQAAAPEVPNWIKLSVEIREQVNRLLHQAADKGHINPAVQSQLTPPIATTGQIQVMDLLGKLAARLHVVMDRMRALTAGLVNLFGSEDSDLYIDDDSFQMDLQALNLNLMECTLALSTWQPADPDAITWFNCNLGYSDPDWEYKTAPLDVGPVFQSLLSSKEALVLCSATLTVAGSFDYLQECLGFDEGTTGYSRWLVLDSPFDYQRQSLMLLADDLASPTGASRDRYLDQIEQVVAGVCGIFPRGILVLFNSYRDLNHVAEHLPFHVDDSRILVQGVSGTRAELADRFRSEGDKVLLATRSFWEGFDVAGEALSCVVLAKLPFANFRDPVHAGRQRAIEADGGDSFKRYSLPLAAMQLKQGFGRLIRTSSDYGCVFLLDSRTGRANYGKVFLDSLPDPGLVKASYAECLSAARSFMNERETS